MRRMPLSPAATALLRALIGRVGKQSDRILLIDCRSVDWQSLTFVGERHHFVLRFVGADAGLLCEQFRFGLPEAEFAIRGQIVADVAVERPPEHDPDGSIRLEIEALTIAE